MNNLDNFGGVYRLNQLKYVKILSIPVSIIVLAYDHWISLYLTKDSVEIMDSAGIIHSNFMHKSLRRFLRVHIYNKNLSITPKLQSDDSSVCALYAAAFLYYRTITNKTLCDFIKIFTTDFDINCSIINDISAVIWPNLKLKK